MTHSWSPFHKSLQKKNQKKTDREIQKSKRKSDLDFRDKEWTELKELRILVVGSADDQILLSLAKRWGWSTASKRWCNVPRAGNNTLVWSLGIICFGSFTTYNLFFFYFFVIHTSDFCLIKSVCQWGFLIYEGIISKDTRYDLHWGVNGVGHFLDAENILNKFLPFVHEVSFP